MIEMEKTGFLITFILGVMFRKTNCARHCSCLTIWTYCCVDLWLPRTDSMNNMSGQRGIEFPG